MEFNLDTATTTEKPKKEKNMSKIDLTKYSAEDLAELINQAKNLQAENEKAGRIDAIAAMLKDAPLGLVEDVFAVLTGAKVISSKEVKASSVKPPKAPKTPKTGAKSVFELVEGKVFFGGQEITATKKDKNGVLRISKAGKGLPPEVEKQEEAIKKILLSLPVI